MNVTAVVPMKGYSARVPRKNLRMIAGRPLFEWILDQLEAAARVNHVIVDTDSDEIADRVRRVFPEIEIHERPRRLRGDFVPMHDIVAHLADRIRSGLLLQTHSTNPLLAASTIDTAIETFLGQANHDSLMGITERRSRFFWPDGRPVNHDPAQLIRTQDLPPLLEENSNIYLAPCEVISRTRRRVGTNPLLYRIDPAEAIDIDDELDFRIADFMLEDRNCE